MPDITPSFPWVDVYKAYLDLGNADKICDSIPAYVGPLRIGLSKGQGRSVFLTENVRAGDLLLCAEALVSGPNESLLQELAKLMLQNHEVQKAVLNLSRGEPKSETKLPDLSLEKLASPSKLKGGRMPIDATWEEVMHAIQSNVFALPHVDGKMVPMHVQSSTSRSGLWLLPAYVNHSCLPNVHKLIVRNKLFLRATRDLDKGAELFESYINPLQPLVQRKAQLSGYGFACKCERCSLEDKLLRTALVEKICNSAGKGNLIESINAARACVQEGLNECRSKKLSIDVDRAKHILMASFGELLRAHAVSLRQRGCVEESVAIWKDVLHILAEVSPCSQVAAIIHSDIVHSLTKANSSKTPIAELADAVAASNACYGGGSQVWRLFHQASLPSGIVDIACQHWDQQSEVDTSIERYEHPTYTVQEDNGGSDIVIRINLPSLSSASSINLDMSAELLRLQEPTLEAEVSVPMPPKVDPESGVAKWSCRCRTLTVRLHKLAVNG